MKRCKHCATAGFVMPLAVCQGLAVPLGPHGAPHLWGQVAPHTELCYSAGAVLVQNL